MNHYHCCQCSPFLLSLRLLSSKNSPLVIINVLDAFFFQFPEILKFLCAYYFQKKDNLLTEMNQSCFFDHKQYSKEMQTY